MSVSSDNKIVAKHVLAAFGGKVDVHAYRHETENLSVDILRCDDRPYKGVTAYSTIGLSDSPMFQVDGTEIPTSLEIAGACATAADYFPNILASASFCILRTRMLYGPGSVLSGYVQEYYASTPVPNLYLTAPFLWEDNLRTLHCETKTVSWLLAVPISEGEREYLLKFGDNALEDLFEKHQIDIFDLDRSSVI